MLAFKDFARQNILLVMAMFFLFAGMILVLFVPLYAAYVIDVGDAFMIAHWTRHFIKNRKKTPPPPDHHLEFDWADFLATHGEVMAVDPLEEEGDDNVGF